MYGSMDSREQLLSRLQLSVDPEAQVLFCCREPCRFALSSTPAQVSEHLRKKNDVSKEERDDATRLRGWDQDNGKDEDGEDEDGEDGEDWDEDLVMADAGEDGAYVSEMLELLFGLIMAFNMEEVTDGRPASTMLVYFSGILGFLTGPTRFLPARLYTSHH